MVGDQPTAEDVVQDAFPALYRRWPTLKDPDRALAYARASVLNGCRMVHRANSRHDGITLAAPEDTKSAEETAWTGAGGTAIGVIEAMAKRQMTIDYTVGLLTPGKFTPLPIRVPAAQGFSAAGLAF
jgi:DNA-directed RNA polymerase specialized sigma24 family protein